MSIRCFNQRAGGLMVRGFVGRTKEGVRLGASLDDVLKTYGKPDRDRSTCRVGPRSPLSRGGWRGH